MTTDFWHADLTLADESSPLNSSLTSSLGSYILGSPGLLVELLVAPAEKKTHPRAPPGGVLVFVDC